MSHFVFPSKRHEHPYRKMQFAKLYAADTALDMRPRLSRDEAILVRLFLRRYVRWCARTGRYDHVEPTRVLYRHIGEKMKRPRRRVIGEVQ